MARGTNGIATWGDLKNLTGLNIPSSMDTTKCPRREQIDNFVDSNYILTFDREYGPYKLVRYDDITLTPRPSMINIANCYIAANNVNLYFSATTVYNIIYSCELYDTNFSESLGSLPCSITSNKYLEIEHADSYGDGNYWLGFPICIGQYSVANAMRFWFNVKIQDGFVSLIGNECYYDFRRLDNSNVRIQTERGDTSGTSCDFALYRIKNTYGSIKSFLSVYQESIINSPFTHIVYGRNNRNLSMELRMANNTHLATWNNSGVYNLLPSGYINSWSTLLSYHTSGYFSDLKLIVYEI